MRLLITGSNGLLGQALIHKLRGQKSISLTATSRSESLIPVDGFRFQRLDICDPEAVGKTFKTLRPDAIIHTAAQTQVDTCELNHAECLRVNVEGTENILRECEKSKTHLIYLSTDFIFDGKTGPYCEMDPPGPVNFYGKSKLLAEQKIGAAGIPWTLLRTILVYGTSRPNFLHWVAGSLQKGQTIHVVTDQIRMPTWNEDLADACIASALESKTGIYHVSGEDRVSIYEFAKQAAQAFNLDESKVLPSTSDQLHQPAQRPLVTGFVLDKARRDLHYKPHSLNAVLKQLRPYFCQQAGFA